MAKRKLIKKLINKSDITEELRQYPNSDVFITPSGKAFVEYDTDVFYPLKLTANSVNGYVYIGMVINGGKRITKRFHRLVAELYIPNPDKLPIVGHLDNNKANNNIENLYWTTISENTQKAFDDKLIINDKGFDDSQSIAIDVYDSNKQFIETIGSVSEASKKYNISKSCVLYNVNINR